MRSPPARGLARIEDSESTETHQDERAEQNYREFQEKFHGEAKTDSDPTLSLNGFEGSPDYDNDEVRLPRQPPKPASNVLSQYSYLVSEEEASMLFVPPLHGNYSFP